MSEANHSLGLLGLPFAVVEVRLGSLRSQAGTIDKRLDDDVTGLTGDQGVHLASSVRLGLLRLLADVFTQCDSLLDSGRIGRFDRLPRRGLGFRVALHYF